MKAALISAFVFSLLMITTPVQAGHGHHHGHGHHAGHYGRHYYGGHRRRHRHHSHKGAYLLGGIVIGSLLSRAYDDANYDRNYNRPSTTRIVYRERTVPIEPRILVQDKVGNCYEVTRRDSVEVRTQIETSACQ